MCNFNSIFKSIFNCLNTALRVLLMSLLVITIVLSVTAIVFGFIKAGSATNIYDKEYFSWNVLAQWLLPAIGALAMSLTGLLIYLQVKEQRKANERQEINEVPLFNSSLTKDNHELTKRQQQINYRQSHIFVNKGNNIGYVKMTVFVLLFDSMKDHNIIYKFYRLRQRRNHKFLTFENEIFVYPSFSISSQYTLPFDLIRCNHNTNNKCDEEDYEIFKKVLEMIAVKKISINEDTSKIEMSDMTSVEKESINNIPDGYHRLYIVFSCAVRSKYSDKYSYIINDVRNLTYDKDVENEDTHKYRLQNPYKLPDFLDDVLPKINNKDQLIPNKDIYEIKARFDESD